MRSVYAKSLKISACIGLILQFGLLTAGAVYGDSRGDELADWLNRQGKRVLGEPPEPCSDLTFARRVYLDLVGRVPSVAELRDFEMIPGERRRKLVENLIFGLGERGDRYARLTSEHLARQWRRVLLPSGAPVGNSAASVEAWLATQFREDIPYDEIMRRLVRVQDGRADADEPVVVDGGVSAQYFQLLGGLPENYAGNVSRVMLGVRIECAQCHDHPFAEWKQEDFWGIAAFYSDLGRRDDSDTSVQSGQFGKIEVDNRVYEAKYLWSEQPIRQSRLALRSRLGEWMTGKENPNFAATAVNRFWQHLVGRGLYADIENLDQADPVDRQLIDELGARFAEDGYQVRRLVAAICKSDWYQAVSGEPPIDEQRFYRPVKSISPEQVFDSLEQSLHLPIGRMDPSSPRWSGERVQLVSRLSESSGGSPEDYSSGIPQALMMMNGRMTNEAVDLQASRLLRAVTESPFFETDDCIEALFLAVLTRRPTEEESTVIAEFLTDKSADAKKRALGELLWALLNSPEFVLCR